MKIHNFEHQETNTHVTIATDHKGRECVTIESAHLRRADDDIPAFMKPQAD